MLSSFAENITGKSMKHIKSKSIYEKLVLLGLTISMGSDRQHTNKAAYIPQKPHCATACWKNSSRFEYISKNALMQA